MGLLGDWDMTWGYLDSQNLSEGWTWIVPVAFDDHKPWRIQWDVRYTRTNPEMSAVLAMVDWDDSSLAPPKQRETPNPLYSEDTLFTHTEQVLEYAIGGHPTTRRNGIKAYHEDYPFGERTEYWEAEECGVPVWGY